MIGAPFGFSFTNVRAKHKRTRLYSKFPLQLYETLLGALVIFKTWLNRPCPFAIRIVPRIFRWDHATVAFWLILACAKPAGCGEILLTPGDVDPVVGIVILSTAVLIRNLHPSQLSTFFIVLLRRGLSYYDKEVYTPETQVGPATIREDLHLAAL